MNRSDCLRYIVARTSREAIVANLGSNTFDLAATKDRDQNFYMPGGMGLTASIGVGLALAQAGRKVIVLDGDGSALMNLSALPLIGDQAPRNLIHIILDNEMWAETGRQPTMTARKTDLAAIARASGIEKVATVRNTEAFQDAFSAALTEEGPWVIVAKIDEAGRTPARAGLPPEVMAHRFMTAMGQ